MTPEQIEQRKQARAEKTRQRMAGVRHTLFGNVVAEKIPGTVFDPLPCFYDPGFFTALLAFFAYRAGRAGVGAGLAKRERVAAIAEASQRGIRMFTDRDYAAEGITADERTRAILSTARRMDRCQWRDDAEDRDGRGDGERKWFPWNRAQNSRTADPKRICHAARLSAEDTAILNGTGTDESKTGRTVAVQGGNYRPWADGKMVERVRECGEYSADGEEYVILDSRWRMDRRRGKIQTYPACAVQGTRDGKHTSRHVPTIVPPMMPWHGQDRTTARPCGAAEYTSDPEAYRAALAEYYAGK